jgi:uncharacterized membrane protein
MTVEERLDRLEQRLTVVEHLVRQLAAASAAAVAPPAPPPHETAPPPAAPPRPPVQAPPPSAAARFPRRPFLAEEWIGQRGLLAVGVLALILAAGYLLKLAFDRNWITPTMRCAGGVLAGVAVGAIGWRLVARYRTYGAALIGCGAAIVYLAVWAAARLYGLVPPTSGIAALALVSLALAAIAYAIDVEALASSAVLGAFFAPVLLGHDRANADLLLVYLGAVGLALGGVAARKRWRLTASLVALSYFSLGWAGVSEARPGRALAYTILGGTGGIWLGLREGWWETRFLAFWGGWALLATVDHRLDLHWPTLAAGALLAAPVWLHGLRSPTALPLRIARAGANAGWSLGEAIYFFTTPFLLGWAVGRALPDVSLSGRGLDAAVIGAAYLGAGYLRPRPPFALVGAMALAWGVLDRWQDLTAATILFGLAAAWAGLDHLLHRTDGRWYATVTLAIGLAHLLDTDAGARLRDDQAFVGQWALVLWLATAVSVALAAGLWRRDPAGPGVRTTVAGLWLVAGSLVLFGVTNEIIRYFAQAGLARPTARLAGGLSVSAWWLVFAAVLVVAGLRSRIRPARLAGLAVAGMAVTKVLVFDLSELDALYRVASVFILGLVSLLLAYLYNRQARGV